MVDSAASTPSLLQTADQIVNPNQIGLVAEYISHCPKSDILGPSREGGKNSRSCFSEPLLMWLSGSQSTLFQQQQLYEAACHISCLRAENSLMRYQHHSREVTSSVFLRELPKLISVPTATDIPGLPTFDCSRETLTGLRHDPVQDS